MVKKATSLELHFLGMWDLLAPDHLRYPECEYRFHPTRKWRFDFAWPEEKVAVEMEGGVFIGGGHTRGKKYTMDCDKYNAAVLDGWRVLRYTIKHMEVRPVQVIEEIAELLK